MRSSKAYTNATFTKRVDHTAGSHHLPKAASEPRVCETCGAVYVHRRWMTAEAASSSSPANSSKKTRFVSGSHLASKTICPACDAEKRGITSGFVYLGGGFLAKHEEEVERLLTNEAKRAADKNATARIMKWDWQTDPQGARNLTLSTTTEHLAKRLGQALEKAFSGDVRYDFSHENKLARVYWHRD